MLPFLALGLGVDDMFLMIQVLREIDEKSGMTERDVCASVLSRGGASITLTSACNACGFFMGALIPLPAVTNFCIAAGLVVLCNWSILLFGFTALISYDTRWKGAGRVDWLALPVVWIFRWDKSSKRRKDRGAQSWIASTYAPMLCENKIKIMVLLASAGIFAAGAYGITQVENGLDIPDAVPKNHYVYGFSVKRFEYFNLYDATIVTGRNVDYASLEIQKLMADLKEELFDLKWTVRVGTGVTSWMHSLGEAIAENIPGDCNSNIQEWCDVCHNSTLLEGGFVDPELFWGCLVLWRANYTTTFVSDAYFSDSDLLSFIPQGRTLDGVKSSGYTVWPSVPDSANEMIDHKVGEIGFGVLTFRVQGMNTTDEYIQMISDVRAVLEKYNGMGLNTYPTGDVFTYWQQYVGLESNFWSTFGYCVLAVFLASLPLLVDPVVSFVVTATSTVIVIEIYGFMSYLDIKFSAIPAVSLIMALGLSVEFTAHMCSAFVDCSAPASCQSSSEKRNAQMRGAVDHVFIPVLQGGVSSFIGFFFLAFTEFVFIRKYFFGLYSLVIAMGLFNGLVFLPVVLSLVGPTNKSNHAATTSPMQRVSSSASSHHKDIEMVATASASANDGTRDDRAITVDDGSNLSLASASSQKSPGRRHHQKGSPSIELTMS